MELVVPHLSCGMGMAIQDGGCVMQVAHWISTGRWDSDRPECVNELLCSYAIWANDASVDSERQKLIGLLPRLLNTPQIEDCVSYDEVRRELGNVFDRWVGWGCTPIETLVAILDRYDELTGRDLSVQTEAPDLSALCALQTR